MLERQSLTKSEFKQAFAKLKFKFSANRQILASPKFVAIRYYNIYCNKSLICNAPIVSSSNIIIMLNYSLLIDENTI